MKFKIVEGNDYLSSIYDDFKTDFINPSYTIKDLMVKYNISFNHYNKLRRRVCEDLGLSCKPKADILKSGVITNNSYISQYGKRFAIFKTLNHKRCRVGVYDDLETARLVRDELVSCDWDISLLDSIHEKIINDKISDRSNFK